MSHPASVSIRTEGHQLIVDFPPASGSIGHTIKLEATQRGFMTLYGILRQRETEARYSLGTKGAPAQAQASAMQMAAQSLDALERKAQLDAKRAEKDAWTKALAEDNMDFLASLLTD